MKLARKHPDPIRGDVDLLGKLIGDLRKIVPDIPQLEQKIANSRFLIHAAEDFLGRKPELDFLDGVWDRRVNVLSLIAWGGVGKTSLVCRWIQRRFIDRQWKDEGTPALWRYFDWSFYDQGSGSLDDDDAHRTGNVGDFFEASLTFFGDVNPTLPGRGTRLAELIRRQHSLLILDGLEPLQAPPNSEQAGQLLDPDLHDLLVGLAQLNPGLCLLTSRQPVRDLAGLSGTAAEVQNLDELPKETAVRLLRKMQIAGTDEELADACERFGCHALSLTLLGRFLFDAHNGDIARIDRVDLHKADRITRPERHRTAWRVLQAYDEWLSAHGSDPTLLAVLRVTGLFDRPATADCLRELRQGDVIVGLTESVHADRMDDDEWNILLKRLERAHLIRLRPSEKVPGEVDVDAHPLVREYFAEQLRTKSPEAFRAAHSRLFDHLCESTEHQPDTLEGLQPLYQAVTHGCLAGRHEEACAKVYRDRILRGTGHDGFYSRKKLGAIGADLGAMAAFFDQPWRRLSPNLSEAAQAWLLNEAAFRLRALGRLTEAREPMQVSLEINEKAEQWKNAAVVASNLSELSVTLGSLVEAVSAGRRAIELADRSGDAFQKMGNRTTAADALFQRGLCEPTALAAGMYDGLPSPSSGEATPEATDLEVRRTDLAEARALFAEAERMQAERQPQFPRLYSLGGFRYCDLLLAPAERAAWQAVLSHSFNGKPQATASLRADACGLPLNEDERTAALAACDEVTDRAEQWFEWRMESDSLLDIALDHLTLARAKLYRAILDRGDEFPTSNFTLQTLEAAHALHQALNGLRQANQLDDLPKALLTASLLRSVKEEEGGVKAEAYLSEAQQIAERGPMPLYLADVHLHRGRLKCEERSLKERREDLAAARGLIEKHNYGRRLPELEAAEAALVNSEEAP